MVYQAGDPAGQGEAIPSADEREGGTGAPDEHRGEYADGAGVGRVPGVLQPHSPPRFPWKPESRGAVPDAAEERGLRGGVPEVVVQCPTSPVTLHELPIMHNTLILTHSE